MADALTSFTADRLDRFVEEKAKMLAPVFQANGWTWRSEGVPSEESIALTLRRLVDVALGGDRTEPQRVATGRLIVWTGFDDAGSFSLELALRLGDLTNWMDDDGVVRPL